MSRLAFGDPNGVAAIAGWEGGTKKLLVDLGRREARSLRRRRVCGRSELGGSPCARSPSRGERPSARVDHGQLVAPLYLWYHFRGVRQSAGTLSA